MTSLFKRPKTPAPVAPTVIPEPVAPPSETAVDVVTADGGVNRRKKRTLRQLTTGFGGLNLGSQGIGVAPNVQ